MYQYIVLNDLRMNYPNHPGHWLVPGADGEKYKFAIIS
jgi:hypothetical protein